MVHITGRKRILAGIVSLVLWVTMLGSALAATYPYSITCAENVNLRKSTSTSSVVLKYIKAGDTVEILGTSGSYYKVKFGGATGYAMKKYVDGTTPTADTIPKGHVQQYAPIQVDTYPYDTYTVASVKLRKTASETGAVIMVIPTGEALTVSSVTNTGFAKVKYDGKSGYVLSLLIALGNIPTPSPIPSPTPHPGLSKYVNLSTGSSGTYVRALQEALIELKFYTGEVDKKFGAKTKTAVNAFKKRNDMVEDGIADEAMQLLLFEGKPKNSRGTKQEVKTVPPVGGITIKSGSTGEAVEKLQMRLKELGFYIGEITGICDKATVQAIKDFQKKQTLKSDGQADSATQNMLYGTSALSANAVVTPTPTVGPTIPPPKTTVREGDSGDDARLVQQQLEKLGYYTGNIDSKFGSSSVAALKAFQEKSGLTADGVCGAQTRTILFGMNPAYAQATAIPVDGTTYTAPLTPETVTVIKAGSYGNAVLTLQQRLTDLGYYSSRLDGVYLEDDFAAVKAFQKANGLTVDGKAGYNTQSLLYSDKAVRGSIAQAGATLRYGDEGTEVTSLQDRLIELGYLTSSADGKFGKATKAALIAFQKKNNLTQDGIAGSKTQIALASIGAEKNAVDSTETLREGSASAAVKDLQNRLITLGYLTGGADGKFGTKTSLALIAFQKKNSLTADGVAGKKTLTALNSTSAKTADGVTPTATAKPTAISISGAPNPANVRYANWYSEVKARCKLYPNATIYDFTTGISWQVNMFSLGAHADAEPLTANDTANMNRAFGGKTTWNPKAVWVVLSDGTIYMASTHNTPHDTSHNRNNNFDGHLCIHFPRTEAQVTSIGPYATSHQKAIDLGWQVTQNSIGR